jgi:hypothetical protein
VLEVIIPSVVSSLLVGMAGAWLASQRALATFEARLSQAERAISRIDATDRANAALLVELKTKMDLILERIIPPTHMLRG